MTRSLDDEAEIARLIERLEQTGPDRELDELVASAFGWSKVANPTHAGGLLGRWYRPDGSMSGHGGPPSFTASIDAAMTLVPEGWSYEIRPRYARLIHPVHSYQDVQAWSRGTNGTTALALCIAALRAHLQSESNKA